MYTVKSLEWAYRTPMVGTAITEFRHVNIEIVQLCVLDNITVRMFLKTTYPNDFSPEDNLAAQRWSSEKVSSLNPDRTICTVVPCEGLWKTILHELVFYPINRQELEYTMMAKYLAFMGGSPDPDAGAPRLVTESFCGKSLDWKNDPAPKPWGTLLQDKVLRKNAKTVK